MLYRTFNDPTAENAYIVGLLSKRDKAVRVNRIIESAETEPLIELGYADAVVKVTQTHPVLTKEGLKKAKDLSVNDSVRGADGVFHKLSKVRDLPVRTGQYVINFELDVKSNSDNDRLVLSDGIVTGDFALQLKLSK